MPWKLDLNHAAVGFTAKHMMITTVRGGFKKFDAIVDVDPSNLASASVEATIEAASIDTGNTQRDAHLRSNDFLAAEEYPTITFKSTRVEPVSDEKLRVYGDLTIRGASKPVVLDTTLEGVGVSPWGAEVIGFNATTTINRKDWNLNWNVALETGGVLVSDKITINIDIELVAVPAEAPVEAAATA